MKKKGSLKTVVESHRVSKRFASPLRYPGGKGRLAPWLSEVLEHNGLTGGCYVEPYAGGAGVALYLLKNGFVNRIVLNDADPFIHAFWRSVVHRTDAFVEKIMDVPVTMETRAHFRSILKEPKGHSQLEIGFAAFFLNRTSRSGILTGGVIGGNDQTGNYKIDARFNKSDLVSRIQSIGRMREQITVLGMDARDLLLRKSKRFSKKTLIYLDPPYYVKGSHLYRNHYRPEDHADIAACAQQSKHPMLITYDDVPEIRELYSGMSSLNFSLKYSTGMTRPIASEVLFYKNLCLPSPPNIVRSTGSGKASGASSKRKKPVTATFS